ncbi:MAG: glycine/betaine/sarcosine/D-proline family reductase selenoprotein B [Spirochaetales bacterium]|nr:glycine/betaine/sarcosine/D-proline family reductase selenoprotein B [Spirochaetales bacterium]
MTDTDKSREVKIVHYINQFFAGIGGEEAGGVPVGFEDGPKGPGTGLTGLLKGEGRIVRTIWCGDNRINQETDEVLEEIRRLIEEVKPDVVLAGPAFNAGRYGLACGLVGRMAKEKLGIPSLVAMYPENPAVDIYKQYCYIYPVGEKAAAMRQALPALAPVVVKLGKNGSLGSALEDGYIQSGYRWNEFVERPAALRAVDMLMKRLSGEDPMTEAPLRGFEQVPPAAPVDDLKQAVIAVITGGGMVPRGNPDKLKQAFADRYGVYSIQGLEELPAAEFKGIHGGYDSTWVDEDPDRVVPLDALRKLEQKGVFAHLHQEYFALCGIGTNVAMSKKLGAELAEELKRKGVSAAIYTST